MGLPQHTLILTLMVEFDFNLAKKVVNWVSNWLKWPKLAVFGHFEGCRGPYRVYFASFLTLRGEFHLVPA